MNKDDFLYVERYRPKTIDECILPQELKETFKSFVKAGQMPNLLLCGGAGIGKTTIARALANELNYDVMFINCSEERGIDTLRTKMMGFCSTVSLTDERKCRFWMSRIILLLTFRRLNIHRTVLSIPVPL